MTSHLRRITLLALALLVAGCSSETKIAEHLAEAGRYYAAGDYDKAEIEYRNVLKEDPSNAEATRHLAFIYYEQNRFSAIHPILNRAISLNPDDVELRAKRGFFELSVGNREAAREHGLFVLERDPSHPEGPIILSEAARTPEEIAAARERLQSLPAETQQGAPVLTALGSLEIRSSQFEAAQATLTRALQRDPSFSAAHAAMAYLHRRQGDLEAVGRSLQKAAETAPPRSPRRLMYAQFLLQSERREAGRQALEAMTTETPDYLPPYLILAEIAAGEEKFDQGIELVNKVLGRDPGHPEALLLSARLKMASGNPNTAVQEMERMVNGYPNMPQAHYYLGMAHMANGNLSLAANSLRQALTLAPDYVEVKLLLADINVRQGDYSGAVTLLLPFVQERPEVVQAQLTLANAQRGLGNAEAALAIYQRLASAAPDNPQFHLLAGTLLRQQNKREEARTALNRVLELSPDNLSAVEQLVAIDLADNRIAEALARVEARLAQGSAPTGLRVLKGRIQLAQRNVQGAEETLRAAAAAAPEAAEPHEALADVYALSNQIDKAVASLEAAATRNPGNVKVLTTLATYHQQNARYEQARDYYEKALAADPRFLPALNNLAYIYAEFLSDLDKAHDLAQRAREVAPNDPNIADTLGWILYRQKQYPWALSLLQESASRMSDHAEVQYHLGMAQYMMGAETAARASLVRALQLSKEFPGREEATRRLEVLSIDPAAPGPDARALLEKALSAEPGDPAALVRLAALEEHAGNVDAAVKTYSQALQSSPGSLAAAGPLVRLHLARNETAQALEIARALRKTLPEDAEVAHLAGRVGLQTGDYAWAYNLLEEAARRKSGDREVQFELAQAAYAVGRVNEAEDALRRSLQGTGVFLKAEEARQFQEMIEVGKDPAEADAAKIQSALSTDPDNLAALMARARLNERMGKSSEARDDYTALLSRYPGFAPATRRLAIMASTEGTGASPEGLQFALKAREVFVDDPELALAYGILLYRNNDFNRARATLGEVTRLAPQNGTAWFYLGATQLQSNQADAGKQSLERSLSLDLPADLANEARKLLGQ